ncbi:hypothetical protein MKW92_022778, partial [Papaver armeniacum]
QAVAVMIMIVRVCCSITDGKVAARVWSRVTEMEEAVVAGDRTKLEFEYAGEWLR